MELPRGWVDASLDEVAERITKGTTPTSNGFKFQERGIAFVKIENIANGRINTNSIANFISADADAAQARSRLKASDILFSIAGTIGRTAVVRPGDLPANTNQALAIITCSDEALFAPYLEYLLTSHVAAETIGRARGGAMNNISLADLRETRVPLAPLNEQRRIVEKIEARFDEIDKGVEGLKTAKIGLGLYRQSLLKSAFEGRLTAKWRARNADKLEAPETLLVSLEEERGAWYESEFQRWREDVAAWESSGSKGPKPRKPDFYKRSVAITDAEHAVLPPLPNEWVYVRLNDIAYVGSGMSVSKARKLEAPVETPYLRVANVQRGHLDLGEIKTMPVEQSQLAGLQLRTWDILFNEGGDRDKLGRGWIWEDQVEICITQNHVFRATPFRHDKGWSQFVSQWGNSYGRDYFEAGGKQTTNLASINKTVLKALPVPICSPAEQAEIVRLLDVRLDAADALEAEIDAALTRASALRQSILKKAFSGQLVPQDPADEPASALLERIKAERAKAPKTRTRLVQA